MIRSLRHILAGSCPTKTLGLGCHLMPTYQPQLGKTQPLQQDISNDLHTKKFSQGEAWQAQLERDLAHLSHWISMAGKNLQRCLWIRGSLPGGPHVPHLDFSISTTGHQLALFQRGEGEAGGR